MTLIIILFILAAALVIAEVMFPSFGLLSLMAGTALLFAALQAFEMGRATGFVTIIGAVVLIPAAIWAGFAIMKHTPIGNKLLVSGKGMAGAAMAKPSLEALVGKRAVATSPLRPSGKIVIHDEPYSALSEGGFVEAGDTVIVTRIEFNQAVVTLVTTDPMASGQPDGSPEERSV